MIRVWDFILDHDNLTRHVELAVERIEKSHARGQKCRLYSELSTGNINNENIKSGNYPKVFHMRQSVKSLQQSLIREQCKYYPPASDDPRQFTLLKFYELNAGAIELILDAKDENVDLPFTPGPKEHEIIHYSSDPSRSILLMGRRLVKFLNS